MQDKARGEIHSNDSQADWTGLSAILLTAITWGLTGVFVRWLSGLSASAVTSGRLLIALLIVAPILLSSRTSRVLFREDLANPWTWMLSGLLTLYYIAAVTAFQAAPIADVALLISSSPLFVLIYQALLGATPSRSEILGAIFGVTGIALITLMGDEPAVSIGTHRMLGDGFALLAAAATAAYAAVFRLTAQRHSAPNAGSVAVLMFTFGGMILGLWTVAAEPPWQTPLSLTMLLAFFALGLISTAVPSIAFGIASRRLPVLVTTTARLTTPVFATLFALLLLDEPPSIWSLPGGVLVISGMYLVIRSHQKAGSPGKPHSNRSAKW